MKKIKIKKKNKMLKIIGLIILLVGVLSLTSFAYFTNISKYLQEQHSPDGYGGIIQNRKSEDFINNGCGTGTILDTVTGLCWMKNLNVANGTKNWSILNTYTKPIFNLTSGNYDWPSGRISTDYPAFKVCNDNTTGGHNDWRLPENPELLTLVNESIDTTCNKLSGFGFLNCQSSLYWTSNQDGVNTVNAFNVNFYYGYGYSYILRAKTNPYFVACVRRNY